MEMFIRGAHRRKCSPVSDRFCVFHNENSSRGQLGLGQLESETTPTLIDGLAGVKVHFMRSFELSH